MTLGDDLLALTRQGVQLWVDGGQLRVRAPKGALTSEGRDLLMARRDEIVALLEHVPNRSSPALQAEQRFLSGPTPLTPRQIQFFRTNTWRESGNIILYEFRGPFDPVLTRRAMAEILVHHDALRSRFTLGAREPGAVIAGREEHEVVSYLDVGGLREPDRVARVKAALREARNRIDIEGGPLLQVVLSRFDSSEDVRVVFLIHHLVADPLSILILAEDLERVHEQLRRGEPVRLPPKTTSLKTWAERLAEYAHSSGIRQELSFWLSAIPQKVAPLPMDHPEALNAPGLMRRFYQGLDQGETYALFHEAPRVHGVQSDRLMLAAVVHAFREWIGSSGLLLELAGHGREALFDDIDVSRTVGWFTSQFPVFLDIPPGIAPSAEVQMVEGTLRRLPHAGIGYGILRYLCPDAEVVEAVDRVPRPQVSFNYIGRTDISPDGMSQFLLDAHVKRQIEGTPRPGRNRLKITGTVHNRCFYLRWGFHEPVHEAETIEALAERTLVALRALLP